MDGFDWNTTQYNPRNALWLAKASLQAYNIGTVEGIVTSDAWGFTKFQSFQDNATDTYGFVAGNADMILVSFRGTEQNLKDWLTDLDAIKADGPTGTGMVHKGFYDALLGVWDNLMATITSFQDKGQKIWFTGHSLGGALATLAVAKMLSETHVSPVNGLYTYGKPRVGAADFEKWFDGLMKSRDFRFVNDDDIVPHVPPDVFGFEHEGTFLYFDGYGNLKTREDLWTLIKNGIGGEVNMIWKDRSLVPVIVYDHLIAHYIEKLEQNKDNNPFVE